MSSEKSLAVVVRLVPWSETSLIVTLLTREHGKIAAVAKGALRPTNPFDGALDLLSICSVVYIDKSGDVLDILTESKLVRQFRSAQRNLPALYCGYYICELLQRATESDTDLHELFDVTDATLLALDSGTSPMSVLLRFELNCLRLLGHAPQLERCTACEQTIELQAKRSAFSVSAGGLLCDDCMAGQREVLRLRNDSVVYLRQLHEQDWRSGEVLILPTHVASEVRQLMNRLFESLLDRRISVSYLLDSIVR